MYIVYLSYKYVIFINYYLSIINFIIGRGEDNSQMFVMNNYFGIGIDADLCLAFHKAREKNPERFNSR